MQLRFTCNDPLCGTCLPGEYVTYDTETRLAFTEPGHRPFEHFGFVGNRTVEGLIDIMKRVPLRWGHSRPCVVSS